MEGLLQALVAGRPGAPRKSQTNPNIVDIGVGGRGGVGDGIGEAVAARRRPKAGRGEDGGIGEKAMVGLLDQGVLTFVVRPTVLVLLDLRPVIGHDGGAGVEVDRTRGIQHLRDADHALGRLKEGVGVLWTITHQ